MADFKSREFKRLQAKWYDTLKETGFRDIEDDRGNLVDHQSVYDFSERIGFRAGIFEENRDYYAWASEMAWHGQFKSPRDQRIWQLHAAGKSSRYIGAFLGMDRRWVSRKIQRMKRELQLQSPKKEAA